MSRWLPSMLVGLAFVSSACQVAVGVDVRLDRDGSGRLELAFRLDQDVTSTMEEIGFDPTLGLAELGARSPGWSVQQSSRDGVEVRVGTDFDHAADLARLVEELHEGLDDADGRIVERLTLTVEPDGRLVVEGEAGLRLPETAGAEGDGVMFDGDDLARLVADRGDEVLLAELRIRFPGTVDDTDADRVDGGSATWQLPLGETRTINAAAYPAADRRLLLVVAAAVVALAAGMVIGVRRRS